MTNFFDQFDPQEEPTGNFFDQFDASCNTNQKKFSEKGGKDV